MKKSLSENIDIKTLKIIGKGGFCRVYEVVHLLYEKPIAIKMVRITVSISLYQSRHKDLI